MNKKLRKFIEPSMKMYFAILVIFAAVSLFFDTRLAALEGASVLLLLIHSIIISRKRRTELAEYIESITYDVESAQNSTLINFPLPIVVFKLKDYRVVWANRMFFSMCGKNIPTFDTVLTDLVPEFSGKWLLEGKSRRAGVLEVSGRKYQIHGNIIRAGKDEQSKDHMGVAYWVDVTEFDDIKLEYHNSRPVIMIIVVDNYDELMKNASDRVKAELRAAVDERVEQWLGGKNGFFSRSDRDRYVFIFEERYLSEMTNDKFSIMDSVRSIVNPSGIYATLSVGVGMDGGNFDENYRFAALSIDMALSRGGDQAVLKNRFGFEFYGGRGTEIETRTKVKSRVMANALNQLIKDSSQVFVMGHELADMDCIGAAAGICSICRKSGIRAHIVINPFRNASHRLIALLCREAEYEDVFISPQEAMLKADGQSLLIIVDTNRPEQVEDQNLLLACNRVVVIDHHRRAASYIQNAALSLHEPYASSVCELMAELLQELTEPRDIMQCEAEAVLSGIVMDTKNFMMRTGERTFEAAAFLRRAGADTAGVKKLLQNDMEQTVARYNILQHARLYRGNIVVAAPDSAQDRVAAARAADELLDISGIQASVVIYPTEDGGVVISARSAGDINVQLLLEDLGGGGNAAAAGAQMSDIDFKDAVGMLYKSIDSYLDG